MQHNNPELTALEENEKLDAKGERNKYLIETYFEDWYLRDQLVEDYRHAGDFYMVNNPLRITSWIQGQVLSKPEQAHVAHPQINQHRVAENLSSTFKSDSSTPEVHRLGIFGNLFNKSPKKAVSPEKAKSLETEVQHTQSGFKPGGKNKP